MELPIFKYHPDPVANKVIVRSGVTCPSCRRNRGYSYEGPYCGPSEAEHVCPWCIHDGKAAARFNLTFVGRHSQAEVADDQKLEELLRRTPGYFSAQGEEWPTHCGDFCALISRPQWAQVDELRGELRPDLDGMQAKLEVPDEEFYEDLKRVHSPLWVYLFRCLTCGTHRIVGDYE